MDLLSRYFHTTLDDGSPTYTGARFETFQGGGDAPAVADAFTAADLVAVSLLSVDVPRGGGTTDPGRRRRQPQQAPLPHPRRPRTAGRRRDPDEIGPSSPAEQLWAVVRSAGVGRVTTSKLLARKRPDLLP